MGFFQYETAKEKYQDVPEAVEILRRLEEFDRYHCLRDSSLAQAGKAARWFPQAPVEYLGWLTVCNGGWLFDTALLSVDAWDPDLGLEFSTLEEANRAEAREGWGLPEGFRVIAVRSYGDPICLREGDARVYGWDSGEGRFTAVWDTFFSFLLEEIQGALELIEQGALEPFPLKDQPGMGGR